MSSPLFLNRPIKLGELFVLPVCDFSTTQALLCMVVAEFVSPNRFPLKNYYEKFE